MAPTYPRCAPRKVTTVLAAAALAGSLTACSGGSGEGTEPSPAPAGTQVSGGTQVADGSASATAPGADHTLDPAQTPLGRHVDLAHTKLPISAVKAIKKARQAVRRGTVFAIELDYSNQYDTWKYQVEIQRGTTDHAVHVSAKIGKVLGQEDERADDTPKAVNPVKPLAYGDALDLAQDKLESEGRTGRLAGWSLEHDDGGALYTFEFGDDPDDVDVKVPVMSKKAYLDD